MRTPIGSAPTPGRPPAGVRPAKSRAAEWTRMYILTIPGDGGTTAATELPSKAP